MSRRSRIASATQDRDHQPVEPGVEPVRIAEAGQVAPGDHQRVLHGILGPVDVAEDPLRDREEPVATRADQVGVCLPVPVSCRLDEIAIHRSLPSAPSGAPSAPLWGTGVACVRKSTAMGMTRRGNL